MAEPAHAPTLPRATTPPRARAPSPADIEPFERDPPPGLGAECIGSLPSPPSREALHRLAGHDLPLDPFERDPLTGLGVEFIESLPVVSSREALHRLTDRDLPSGDGLPMPDGWLQGPVLRDVVFAFEHHFRRRPGVLVGSDNLLYAERSPDAVGMRPLSLAPDVMVAFGVEERVRHSYMVWREGVPPAFVLEVASPSTWRRDRDVKPGLYASMGVREYFLYDPLGGWLEPRLQGHVLEGGGYRRLRAGRMESGARGVWSEVLGLWAFLKGEDEALRWYDPETGKVLETAAETRAAREMEASARQAAEARAAEEAAAREAAEARATEEAAARKVEASAREAAEARIAELQARIHALEGGADE